MFTYNTYICSRYFLITDFPKQQVNNLSLTLNNVVHRKIKSLLKYKIR